MSGALARDGKARELKKRTTRIQHLEAQIIAARRTPEDLAALVTTIGHAGTDAGRLARRLADRRRSEFR